MLECVKQAIFIRIVVRRIELSQHHDAAAIQATIRAGLPAASGTHVEAITADGARVRIAVDDSMKRPGNTVSGPALFGAADTAMYAAILAHAGTDVLAVTTDTTIHFLRKPPIADVIAEARIIKLGKRLVVCAVEIRSVGSDALVAHATGTYSLPSR